MSWLLMAGLWFVVFLSVVSVGVSRLIVMILNWLVIVVEVRWHRLMLLALLVLDAVAES